MPNLPIVLPIGHIAIYGTGTMVSSSGVANTAPNGILRWGSIYQVWDGGATYIYGGDTVMFKESDVVCRIASQNIPYTIVPARLATKDNPPL